MTDEVKLAFDHPEARAAATSDRKLPPDRISLRDHIVEVEIGAFQTERGTTQRVCFNVVVEVQPPEEPLDDDVDKILSYDTITDAIADALGFERLNLLETLAERVAARILQSPQALRTFVRIEKLDRGPGALGVEIVRSRVRPEQLPELPEGEMQVHPLVVFLSDAAIHAPRLEAWLDELERRETPAILCVAPPPLPTPESGNAATQRRIALLAIEQNAWVLAARDRRCMVVDSRTELDWAARHGHFSVWAPSKIVLDAVDGPGQEVTAAPDLAVWFAGWIGASHVLFIGAEPPEGAPVGTSSLAADAESLATGLPSLA